MHETQCFLRHLLHFFKIDCSDSKPVGSSLLKIYQNKGFLKPARIFGKMQVGENPYSDIFDAVLNEMGQSIQKWTK